jgi:nucleoside-diphosphate-sugar epimerase
MRNEKTLLTGATGIVGCEIVREFFSNDGDASIAVLLRGTAADIEMKRRWLLQWSEVPEAQASRLEIVAGDMTLPALGLSPEGRARLESITGIIHAGAVTRFDQSPEAALRNNVRSTSNVIDFAKGCRHIERVAIVSTAFVAGRRSGTIHEDDLDFDAGFNNEYEHSKALAEREARTAMRDLPISVLRLAIVVGRRGDGCISRLSGLYPVLRLFHQGLLAMFPGRPDQIIDLIPSDFAARAIWHLSGRAFQSGSTYHICAGRDRSFRLDELFPSVAMCIGEVDARWKRRGQPLPIPVSSDVFQQFIQIVELTGNPRLKEIIQQMETVTRQLDTPKVFDTMRFDRAIAPYGPPLTHVREWLQPIIARAIETRWQHPVRSIQNHA